MATTVSRDPGATRARIVDAAFLEMHDHGFQGASLSRIVERAVTTKGALFHHFTGKYALGYAVVEEVLRPMAQKLWIDRFRLSSDPVKDVVALLTEMRDMLGRNCLMLNRGCPINNLAQEMSALDEGFRERIADIYQEWRECLADAFRRGIKAGTVSPDVDAAATAAFLVSAFAGIYGTAKNARCMTLLEQSTNGLNAYLITLSPPRNR